MAVNLPWSTSISSARAPSPQSTSTSINQHTKISHCCNLTNGPPVGGGINIFVKPAPPIVIERFEVWAWQHFGKPATVVFEADDSESSKGDVYKLKDPTAECTFNYRTNDDPWVYRDAVLPWLGSLSTDHS
ncbi:hypothetical protein C8R42DRAFT_638726 [Lentinula raphanica]|nr:hypothetical protein C8R42DRAFT_638726 [Lentinula raphanica]